MTVRRPCRCGHEKDAHAHYRRGSDCSGCPCDRFQGQLEVVVRLGRARPVGRVVLPDDPYVAESPWLRPTHTVGTTAWADPPPDVPQHVVRPRTPADAPVAEPARRG